MIPFIAPQAFFIVIFVVADVMAALIGQITFGKSHFSGCSRPIFLGPPIMELAPKRMSCLHRFRPGRFFGYFMCRQKISVTATSYMCRRQRFSWSCNIMFNVVSRAQIGSISGDDMQSVSNEETSFTSLCQFWKILWQFRCQWHNLNHGSSDLWPLAEA